MDIINPGSHPISRILHRSASGLIKLLDDAFHQFSDFLGNSHAVNGVDHRAPLRITFLV